VTTEEEERIYECDMCGHAYTRRYGRDVEFPGGVNWLCWSCPCKHTTTHVERVSTGNPLFPVAGKVTCARCGKTIRDNTEGKS
jgi:hypothetical protein